MKLVDGDALILTEPSWEVTEFDSEFAKIIAEMFLTLDDSGGVALAAPQVGIPLRVVVYALPDGSRGHMVNPKIVSRSKKTRAVTEGCLSFPGMYWRVRRYLSVGTTHQDRFGSVHARTWHGLGAQMVQHELDHLDGILLPSKALRQVA